VLFIDDYHWADESTRGVIQYLARRLAWTPTLLLLATRSSGSQAAELGPFRGMAGVAAIHEVKLKGLPEAATRQIISWFADRFSLDLGPEAYGYLFAHTRGHPFFLIEVMKAVGERSIDVDRLVARGRGRAPGGELLPGSVEDYVRRRGAELAPAAQECLAVLAVLGPDASIATLREVCGWSEPQLRTALEELVRVGFVDLDGEDVGFTHDLIREAAYRSLTGARRRMLHGSVARALMRRSDASSGSIAMHLELACEGGSAHGYAVRAIEHYRRVHAYDEADYFDRMAIGPSGAEEAGAGGGIRGVPVPHAEVCRSGNPAFEAARGVREERGSARDAVDGRATAGDPDQAGRGAGGVALPRAGADGGAGGAVGGCGVAGDGERPAPARGARCGAGAGDPGGDRAGQGNRIPPPRKPAEDRSAHGGGDHDGPLRGCGGRVGAGGPGGAGGDRKSVV